MINRLESPDDTKRAKFLIVENDANDAYLIRRALSASPQCGQSFVCRNPGEARSFLKGAGIYQDRETYPLPDVVITDINLGVESGIEFVDWLRQQPAPIRDCKVVILTGSATALQFDAAEKVGADKVYRKPVRLEDLQQLLSSVAEEFCK
jgi:CheY-like chemotaxis protein